MKDRKERVVDTPGPTLWHQEHVMAENRQKIRASEAVPCACGRTSTVFDIALARWMCGPCAAADFQRLRETVVPTPIIERRRR